RDELVAALDEWAATRAKATSWSHPGTRRLLDVARAADPDEHRNWIRDWCASKDRATLKKLASLPVQDLPLATSLLFVSALLTAKPDQQMIAILEGAHRQRPDDFWINHDLAYALMQGSNPRWDEAVRYLTAALVLRPDSPGIHNNLGVALARKGSVDEGID